MSSSKKLSAHRASKIRFSQEVSLEEHCVDCVNKPDGVTEVHVGLLAIFHNYEINFRIKDSLGSGVKMPDLQTPAIEVIALNPTDDGHDITVNLKCNVEGKFHEEIKLENSDGESLTLQFVAMIMGENQGTPALKSGVRLLSKNVDMLSNANTEWKGFQDDDDET